MEKQYQSIVILLASPHSNIDRLGCSKSTESTVGYLVTVSRNREQQNILSVWGGLTDAGGHIWLVFCI